VPNRKLRSGVLNPKAERYMNPEGDTEYLAPGDMLTATAEFELYAFHLPGGESTTSGEHRGLVSIREGDIIQFIGRHGFMREGHAYLKPVPLFRFKLIRLDQKGKVKEEIMFVIKNVETLLKWCEVLEFDE
jgi:hypothetical protein